MMKFKIGDKVRVKANLKDFNWNEAPCIIEEMLKYADKVFTIKSIDGKKHYMLGTDGWSWNEKWLELAEQNILDDVEFNYLLNIIKPFMSRVKGIKKRQGFNYTTKENIVIYLNNGEGCLYIEQIYLPSFKIDTMYKGMEPDKTYTLEELGFIKPKKKVGDLICKDIECDNCPLLCINCINDKNDDLFLTYKKTIEKFPELEPMKKYIENELNKEIKK